MHELGGVATGRSPTVAATSDRFALPSGSAAPTNPSLYLNHPTLPNPTLPPPSGGVHYPPKKHRRPILFRGVSGNHPTFKGGVYSGNRFPPPFSGHIGTKRCLARGEPRSQLTVCRMPIALAAACFLRWRMKRLRRPLIGHQRRRTPRKFQGTPRESHVDPATEEESSVCAAYSA